MTVSTLVDNDVVIKLAQMDAYADVMNCIGAEQGSIGSLKPMLRYMGIADARRRAKLTKSQAEADRLSEVLYTIVELEMTDEEARVSAAVMKQVLEAGHDIQQGELALMVVATCRGGLDVCTGDKRALRSIPLLEKLWSEVGVLRGMFICLEQLFMRLCGVKGLGRVRTAVLTAPDADITVTFVYRQTSIGGDEAFKKGMRLVIEEHIQGPAPGWLKSL